MSDLQINCLGLAILLIVWFTAADARIAVAIRGFYRKIFRR